MHDKKKNYHYFDFVNMCISLVQCIMKAFSYNNNNNKNLIVIL